MYYDEYDENGNYVTSYCVKCDRNMYSCECYDEKENEDGN